MSSYEPGVDNLEIQRGATFRKSWFFFGTDGETPLDLTGWAVFSEIRETPGGVLVIDLGALMVISDPAGGQVDLELVPDTSKILKDGPWGWDLTFTDVAGIRFPRLLIGDALIFDPFTVTA